MSVYVDALFDYGWKLGKSCHLTADTLDELHDFAINKCGMKRSWFQLSKKGMPHYDLVTRRRKMAVDNGAIEISGWSNISAHNNTIIENCK